MASPIAYCIFCGTIFEAKAFNFGPGCTNITLTNNKVQCPNCHQMAGVADGVFDAAADALKVVSAPALTEALYESFAKLVEEARATAMKPAEFIERAQAINPELGKVVKALTNSKTTWALTLALMLAALNKCSVNVEVKLDANQLIKQVLVQDATKAKK
jgi:hypothetical protein